jgi:hypothetical protein
MCKMKTSARNFLSNFYREAQLGEWSGLIWRKSREFLWEDRSVEFLRAPLCPALFATTWHLPLEGGDCALISAFANPSTL